MKRTMRIMIMALMIVAMIFAMTSCFGWFKTNNDHVHQMSDEPLVTTAPTCVAKGSGVYVCTDCGEKLNTVEIPATGIHSEVTVASVAATCTETGLTEGKKCKDCNTVIVEQTVVPVKSHSEVVLNAVDATCTTTGLTEGKKCSECNTILVAQETIPISNVHDEEVLPAVAATCVTTGLTEGKKCKDCGTVTVEQTVIEINNEAHTTKVLDKVDATCTTTGLTEGLMCIACETVLIEQTEIAVKEHIPGEPVVTEATSKVNGKSEILCTVCNTVMNSEILYATGSVGLDYEPIYLMDDAGNEYEALQVAGRGTCADAEIVIPAMYENKKVVSIATSAFEDDNIIVSIEFLPNGNVTTINDFAFYGCTNLTKADLSNTVNLQINLAVFAECSSLTTVIVDESIRGYDDTAFRNTNISYNTYDNANYLGTNTNPYYVLVSVVDKNATNYNVHNDTRIIGAYAFSDCVNLTSINLENITAIYTKAFNNCTALTSVHIGSNISSLGRWVFNGVQNMTINIDVGSERLMDIAYGTLDSDPDVFITTVCNDRTVNWNGWEIQ